MKKLTKKTTSKNKKLKEDYEKYRWFFTSNNHLVVGGKSAENNEQLIKEYKKFPKYVVMHTKTPGSPFSIILSDKFTEKDLEEAAIFTGCFSRAWKEGKKSIMIDIFLMEQLVKNKTMKTGTFGVVGPIDRKNVDLKLYFEIQKGKARFVPQKTRSNLSIIPGNIKKEELAEQISIKLEVPKDELIQALPTGNSKTTK